MSVDSSTVAAGSPQVSPGMQSNGPEARRLFVLYTGGYIDRLYGPANAARRAEILSAIDCRKVPKSKAAWHIFRSAVIAMYGIGRDCIARENKMIVAAAVEMQRQDALPVLTLEGGAS